MDQNKYAEELKMRYVNGQITHAQYEEMLAAPPPSAISSAKAVGSSNSIGAQPFPPPSASTQITEGNSAQNYYQRKNGIIFGPIILFIGLFIQWSYLSNPKPSFFLILVSILLEGMGFALTIRGLWALYKGK